MQKLRLKRLSKSHNNHHNLKHQLNAIRMRTQKPQSLQKAAKKERKLQKHKSLAQKEKVQGDRVLI